MQSTTPTTLRREAAGPGVAMTLGLCFIVALLEGLDLQSIGVAAPRMAREFGLSVGQMGLAFSAGTFGLLPGAMLGGRLADRIGRKRVLILATALFGLFSIATAQVWDFNSLLMIRVATGIGLGAAMPNLIALCAEAVPTRLRNTAVSVMYCGIPFGGAIAAVVGMLSTGDSGWRHIFYVGGFGPLVVVPLLLTLQESRRFDSAQRGAGAIQPPPVSWALFGERRLAATLCLWVSYFFTLIVLYFLLNWLPSLMAAQGLSRPQVGMVQILFNIGGGAGALDAVEVRPPERWQRAGRRHSGPRDHQEGRPVVGLIVALGPPANTGAIPGDIDHHIGSLRGRIVDAGVEQNAIGANLKLIVMHRVRFPRS